MVARVKEIVQKDANAFKAELLCTALCHCAAGAVRPRMNNGMSDAAYEQICVSLGLTTTSLNLCLGF